MNLGNHSMKCDFCWYWWTCWPSFNELKWEVIFVDIGVIIDITQWVDVRGDFCWYWWNCLTSLNELRWVDIGGIVDHHSRVKVRGDFCWYWWNCWPSLNVLRWEVIFVDIGEIVDNHSMYWDERWFLLILVELLTITQWDEVRGDFC